MMSRITPCLWFDKNAEEAARYYESVFPDSRVTRITRSPSDYPSGAEGAVITVEFTVAGLELMGLNGGPYFTFTEAVSLSVACEDQAEVDRLWDTLIGDGGEASQCGWLKDKFGLSWQIVPKVLPEMLAGEDRAAARRAMQAMMEMTKLDIAALELAFAGA
jgi:2-polyprenyl-6-hydroxyphenyl methylase/3-demethylubiquinone-9 3-methyltransferase